MTTLANKTEILTLLQNPMFQAFLEIDSREGYLEKSSEFPNELFEYHAGKWDEEGAGIHLFSTPKRSNNIGRTYGTWLTVSKLYGNPELPFRVQAAEYVPWGVEVDLQDVGDYRTLGEAVEAAFQVHEHGVIELDRKGFDAQGRYSRMDPLVEVPKAHMESAHSRAVNDAVLMMESQREHRKSLKMIEAEAFKKRWDVPVKLSDVPALLDQINAQIAVVKLPQSTDGYLHLAASMNREFFSGQGRLINCHNKDLIQYEAHQCGVFEVGVVGSTFVCVERGGYLDSVYINTDGVFGTKTEAEASVVANLTKLYEPTFQPMEVGPDISLCKLDGDEYYEIDLDQNTFSPVKDEPMPPEQDPDNPYEDDEVIFDRIVSRVANAYKNAREKQYQAALQNDGISL
jgi:hypothetical protein